MTASMLRAANKWLRVHANQLRDALYPTSVGLAAHRLLFAARSGIVPDGVADLGLGEMAVCEHRAGTRQQMG